MASLICIFDFDYTLTENDSGRAAAHALGVGEHFNFLVSVPPDRQLQWTDLIGTMLKPFPLSQVREAAAESIEVHEGMVRAMALLGDLQQRGLRDPAALQVEVCIASDSNSAFVEGTFHRHFPSVRIDQIHTNSLVSANGDTSTDMHWYLPKGSNPCKHCTPHTPNMCKSVIVRRILEASRLRNPVVLYIGDGTNDVCPARNVLRSCDIVAARRGYPLRAALHRASSSIAATVVDWEHGDEFHRWLASFVVNRRASA